MKGRLKARVVQHFEEFQAQIDLVFLQHSNTAGHHVRVGVGVAKAAQRVVPSVPKDSGRDPGNDQITAKL